MKWYCPYSVWVLFSYLLNMVLTNCTYKFIMPASDKSKDMVTTTPTPSKATLGWAWLPGCHCIPHLPTSPYCFLHGFICQHMRRDE